MKKIFILFFASLAILFLLSSTVFAQQPLVPCGNGSPTKDDGTPNPAYKACTIADFFELIARVYGFMVRYIATSLAALMIIIGAVMMMVSAGNQGLYSSGKKMITYAIVGLVLVFGSWLIIDTLLKMIGYVAPGGNWSTLPKN